MKKEYKPTISFFENDFRATVDNYGAGVDPENPIIPDAADSPTNTFVLFYLDNPGFINQLLKNQEWTYFDLNSAKYRISSDSDDLDEGVALFPDELQIEMMGPDGEYQEISGRVIDQWYGAMQMARYLRDRI